MSNRTLKQIKAPIAGDMIRFNETFKKSLKSGTPLLDKIMAYVVKTKGKQMRPMFAILSAKIIGDANERTYVGASMVELLHTATLVHDDVVDDSNYRRGFFSINALWKNKIAVLIGDYLLSKGLLVALKSDEFAMLKELSTTVEEMSEGELLQIEKARKLDITEDIYYDIIKNKTASLIASSCAVGGLSVDADTEHVELLREIGEAVGIAFQIRDDLFDYGVDDIGKPVGNDIKEKKMTLPLIYALDKASFLEKKRIIHIVKRNNNDPVKVKKVISFVKENGGLEYAQQAMYEYREKAFQLLDRLPDNEASRSMKDLITFVRERKK